jgi:predicted transcriptional regulator YheO
MAGVNKFDMEYRFRTPGGQITWIKGVASPLLDKDGKLNGYIGINVDISRIKEFEIELMKNKEHLEFLNKNFIDRELRMVELKKEINELLIKSGGKAKYAIHSSND